MYRTSDVFHIQVKVKKIMKDDPETFFKIFQGTIQEQTNESVANDEYLKHQETFHVKHPALFIGDVFEMQVKVRLNQKYGYYLQVVDEPTLIMPSDEKEMGQFLQKRLAGIGAKTVKKLMDAYGMSVISAVLENPNEMVSFGIPQNKAESIAKQMQGLSAFDTLSSFLFPMNVPIKISHLIFNEMGPESMQLVQRNPYDIAGIEGVAFETADIIANTLHKNPLSPERIRAGIKAYLTNRKESQGDICVPKTALYAEFIPYLTRNGAFFSYQNERITEAMIGDALTSLIHKEEVLMENNKAGMDYYYLAEMNRVENQIVGTLVSLENDFRIPFAEPSKVEEYLVRLENGDFLSREQKESGIAPMVLAPEQRQAVGMAVKNHISILTGGPGTGKTATVNTIVEALLYANPGVKIALLAPTGKAAKRISELTHRSAMTIHRKLKLAGYGSGEGIEKITEDFVIVDEVSMVDAELFNFLIQNLGENTRLLLVGDVDQLPSIGAGLILRDLIETHCIAVTKLTQIFRQAQNSQIVMNAHKLMNGRTTADKGGITFDKSKKDMYFIKQSDENNVKRLIVEAVRKQVEVYHRNLDDLCVLSPMRVGGLGTIELNKQIQKIMNPPAKGKMELTIKKEETIIYREGDRVMQLVNDSDKDVTNGEIGTIERIYTDLIQQENGTVRSVQMVDVLFKDSLMGERTLSYEEGDLSDIELAYAISIHKSQGSEFAIVIMPVFHTQRNMLQRNLIYTAWTRAKEMLINIGELDSLNEGIKNIQNLDRISLLKEKIQAKLPQVA